MDRLNQLRAGAGGSAGGGDATLDSSSPPSEAYMSADESSSKYFSLSDSTFDITPIKDVSLASVASTHEPDHTMTDDLISDLSPITKKDVMLDSFKIGKQIEAANILSGGVDIFDDNDNSFDGDELVIDDNVEMDDKTSLDKESQLDDAVSESTLVETSVDLGSKDTEVVLQIDGNNVDAIDIGNGLYLYRKEGQEELAAVQIITEDNQAPTFKFLKVRENAEGNLEVYEEFEIEVSKDEPVNEVKPLTKSAPHIPNKVTSNKAAEKIDITPPKQVSSSSKAEVQSEIKEPEQKPEVNFNGKLMKINESRKSPVVGSFTPMTYHSTPNKEGKPLTKTMVDQQLHPSRHSDNVKKTIEVHTDSQKKQATDEIKPKPESQGKKIDDIVIETKEPSTQTETKITGQDSPNPKELKQMDSDCSTKSNVVKVSTEDENKANTDDAVSSSKNTIDSAIGNNKLPENNKVLPATEIVPKDLEIIDKIDLPKTQDSNTPAKSIPDVVKTFSDTEFPKVNQTHKEPSTKTCLNESSEKPRSNNIPDINTSDVENAEPISMIIDQVTENTIQKVVKIDETVQEATSSTIDLNSSQPEHQKKDNNQSTGKDSTNAVSSTSSDQSNKSEEYVNMPKASTITKVDNEVQEVEDTTVNDIPVPETANLIQKEESKPESSDFEPPKHTEEKPPKQALVDKVNEVEKRTKSESGKLPQNIKEKEPTTPLVLVPNVETKTEGSEKVDNTTVPKTDSKKDQNNSAAQGIASNKISVENSSLVAKPIKPELKTEIISPVSINETTTFESNAKSIVLENKIDQKPIPPVNKFIQVPKGMKLKIVPKSGVLNPVEKKVEQTPLSHTALASAAKLNEPKTYLKALKPVSKGNEQKIVPKTGQPITKGFELKTLSKTVPLNPSKGIDPKIERLIKPEQQSEQIPKNKAVIITSDQIIVSSKIESAFTLGSQAKPINNNHTAVPFGKWTDANRQEFLNKFKEIKAPATSTTKQIKNSNDLNRIDVLKKIDSQRHNNKAQDKTNVKDTMFSTKIAASQETKIPVKTEGLKLKAKYDPKNAISENTSSETVSSTISSHADVPQQEERREVNFNDLIGKAIEDMLNRPVSMPMTRSPLDEPRQIETKPETNEPQLIDVLKPKADHLKVKQDQKKIKTDQKEVDQKVKVDQPQKAKTDSQKHKTDQKVLGHQSNDEEGSSGSLDDIEMKMNELHGIPFVERPPHELPKVYKTYSKSGKETKQSKGAKKLLPSTSKKPPIQDNIIELESDEEVIEHEPITGDMVQTKRVSEPVKPNTSEKIEHKENAKKPVITENDFDKFARRNSKSFENCLAVNFDGKESTNVVQTIKEKEPPKNYSLNKIVTDGKSKLPKQVSSTINISKDLPNTKFGSVPEDPNNKNYQLKIHTAYQSALTAKSQLDHPISIIEEKPVKVVFMDANTEFVPNQLNVQGKELSPAKKAVPESANVNVDVTEAIEDKHDDTKIKTKHQRKQVLTPVDAPELEIIQPRDFDVSPKKKRKTEDNKTEKSPKNLVHKKSYLLGRTGPDSKTAPQDVIMNVNEAINVAVSATDRTVSAIDSLVKAAELLENQSVQNVIPNSESPQDTPVKRGRGRPRKYPLPDGATNNKTISPSPSPQKKLRLIDAKPIQKDPISDEGSSDDEPIIRENWTMGKINENIVCPICNKLFRSENVVFKHVKHCSGVSPTRSDLEIRKRLNSKDSDNQSESLSEDMDFYEKPRKTPKKRSLKETPRKESPTEEIEIIVIEDTPLKNPECELEPNKNEPTDEMKLKSKSITEVANKVEEKEDKIKVPDAKPKRELTLKEIADKKLKSKQSDIKNVEEKTDKKSVEEPAGENTEKNKKRMSVQQSSNLVCEFCGKTFRQPSYLVNHKLQHQKEQMKKLDAKLSAKLQVFSCDVCKKEFRKLHLLVQHRIIHNPEVPTRTTRKSSSEQSETKAKETAASKQNDDTSAGFRCEPCDKSFRKLHHLVEHRETHDGINRQKINPQTVAQPIEKPPPPPQCDVCKKSFRKLHHLIEHKEQHHNNVEQTETSSEKSDDKSVQSSLSTRDIIHECSLCYMVFPNEHSHNKHFIFCQQKKKRQSKAKDKPANTDEIVEEFLITEDSTDAEDVPEIVQDKITKDEILKIEQDNKIKPEPEIEDKVSEKPEVEKATKEDKPIAVLEVPKAQEKEITEVKSAPAKRDLQRLSNNSDEKKTIPEKTKKIETNIVPPKKAAAKEKIAPTVTKRQKSVAPLPALLEENPAKSSDEDEVRYMLNPNFKEDESNEGKVFMKVRSNKRNSLQIERPNSRDLVNRRTSLQHPPKIPRLKAKAVEPKVVPAVVKANPKPKPANNVQAATDSDDSDVKYSFPETVAKETAKPKETPKEKKAARKSMADKRKSLSGIAKRKSLGQGIAKLKVNTPIRVIKRRTLDVEHRCDCGQLFNSAALLSRHTSLAHTPPRIRRRRSPPPEPSPKPPRKSAPPAKSTRTSGGRSEAAASKPIRKSSVKADTPATRKSVVPESQEKKSSAKPKRNAAHRGVPVPEKMRKLMMRSAK